jgi:hypothetical protein
VVLGLLSDLISRYTVYWFLFLGISMIAIALVAPNGLMHLTEALRCGGTPTENGRRLDPRRRRHRDPGSAVPREGEVP